MWNIQFLHLACIICPHTEVFSYMQLSIKWYYPRHNNFKYILCLFRRKEKLLVLLLSRRQGFYFIVNTVCQHLSDCLCIYPLKECLPLIKGRLHLWQSRNICINHLCTEISGASLGTEHSTGCINSIRASEEHYNINFLLMSQTKLENNEFTPFIPGQILVQKMKQWKRWSNIEPAKQTALLYMACLAIN